MTMNDGGLPRSPRPHLSLQTTQPQAFGHGWISGALSVALGILGLAAVLCFHFPSWLTMPALRGLYPVPYVRALLYLVLVASFLLGTVSVCLRYNKALGLVGIVLTLLAALLGGSQVAVDGSTTSGGPFLGLDWFLLNLMLYSTVYVPLERLFALHPEQPIFRRGWRTDLTYFFVSTLGIQVTSFLTLQPALVLFDWAREPRITSWVESLPLPAQIVGVLLAADFTQYRVHRAFHGFPLLWRFHAVHHSAEAMDWLAGSRLHLVDAIVTRGTTYIPIYVLGFSQSAIVVYIVVVVVQATFIHANVRWKFGPLRRLVATPAFHHWHHSAEPEAVDKNFAVHTPIWDSLFGTYYLPDRWPAAYGLSGGNQDVPAGWFRQFVFPFRRRRKEAEESLHNDEQ
ncbi:MAG: sterol desaturase family protein [Planctomycetaceae bacterium]|nr:sterol desaturase family protein [Planctomycetaceae bacterium]